MKKNYILLASLIAGLLAAVLTRVYLSTKESEYSKAKDKLMREYGTFEVICLKKDVPAGTVLSASEIGSIIAPKRGLIGHAIERADYKQIIGRKLLYSRKGKEIMFWSDLEGGESLAKGLSTSVSRQKRAISINVSGAAAVSCMVKPNDHVDVIGTFNFPGEDGKIKKGDLVTCTILQNVLVLATGKQTAKSDDRELGVASGYSMVTLEVTPREAEMLAFAEQIKGRLVLTLRNRNDTSTEKELPNVDFEKIRSEIEELNAKRQLENMSRTR